MVSNVIFLHCGLRKTGSTSIQDAASSGLLSGVRYSRRSRTELALDRPSERWLRRIQRAGRREKILLSSENFFRRPNFLAKEPMAPRARHMLNRLGRDQTTMVLYVRPHLPWIESMYFQSIQNRRSEKPGEFLASYLESRAPELGRPLNELVGEVGRDRLVIRLFDPRHDVVADIADVIGARLSDVPREHSNPSLPHDEMWALATINSVDPGLCWFAMDVIRRELRPSGGVRRSVFSADEQALIIDRFHDDWMSLAPLISADDESPQEALRRTWADSVAGRPLPQSTPSPETDARAAEMVSYLRSVRGRFDTRVVERLRHRRRSIESVRWRLKLGF